MRNLRQLLASTRRRWTILQMLESAGLGLLTASLVLAPILIGLAWKGESAAPLFFIILICSLILGLSWGFLKRPSNVLTALFIDRQCNLAELLSSAWLLAFIPSPGTPGEGQGGGRAPNPDPLHGPPPEYRRRESGLLPILNEPLLSLADSRAKAIRSSSIRLHRLSARTWFLITLMIALNIALIVMASNRASTNVRLLAEVSTNSRQSTQSIDEPLVDLALSSPARAVMSQDPDDPNASRIGESNSQKPAKEGHHESGEETNRRADNARADGGGTGIATTHEPTSLHPRADEQPEQSDAVSTGDGKTATGSGVANTNASPQHPSDHADATAHVASPQAPESPWQSPSWRADVSKAQLAVSHGQFPATYQDLLAAYFR